MQNFEYIARVTEISRLVVGSVVREGPLHRDIVALMQFPSAPKEVYARFRGLVRAVINALEAFRNS